MLRITKKINGQVVFRVSGHLTAENVSEMEALIAAANHSQESPKWHSNKASMRAS
jgi:hypothetical protein